MDDPLSLAIDADDYVYVVDEWTGKKFDSTGALIIQWSTNNNGKNNFDASSGVAVDVLSNV